MKVSYAQNYEDILIDRIFSNKKDGFYVDVGAAHPVKDSVTRYFYKKGWRGINIEPNEHYSQLLKKDRPRDINLWCAIGDENGEVDYFYVPSDPKISFIGQSQDFSQGPYRDKNIEKKRVALKTLDGVCREHAVTGIDFLKIDVEGAEDLVLSGADLESLSPRLIVIESVEVKGATVIEALWRSKIEDSGYVRAYFDGINSYFVKAEDKRALEAYSLPLNAQDNFVRYQHIRPQNLLKGLFKNY